jgi:hypothetical protein
VSVVGLAFLCPPILTRDVYAYVAYGRLAFIHGANPYINDRAVLHAAGDPSAAFLVWSSPLPYGPLWTIVATVLAVCGRFGGLYGEVVAHKLVAGVTLLVAAGGAARVSELREAGRGRLTFLAIVFNPLLLLEGPGTGHNDFVMIACLMWSAVLFAEGRHRLSALTAGLAIAVKPVAIVAMPAFLLEDWLRETGARRWRATVESVVLAAAPFVLLSWPFGGSILVARSFLEQGGAPLGTFGLILGGAIDVAALLWTWRFVSTHARTLAAAWLVAWIPLSMALILVGTRQWFPWYVSWALIPALSGWDERHRVLTTVAAAFGVLLTWVYTYRP